MGETDSAFASRAARSGFAGVTDHFLAARRVWIGRRPPPKR